MKVIPQTPLLPCIVLKNNDLEFLMYTYEFTTKTKKATRVSILDICFIDGWMMIWLIPSPAN